MARADLLLDIVRAGAEGNHDLFRRALEALVAEERGKQHYVLADQLAVHLAGNRNGSAFRAQPKTPVFDVERAFVAVRALRPLADLILPSLVRGAISELIEEQQRVDLLRAHNIEPRHRVLLSGPPGNGKTTLAEAIAFELAVPLFVVRYEAVIASYLGETAIRISKLFAQARTDRCVLFFDEFDVVGKERGDVHETGEIKRVVSSLLLQVDQLPSHVVVVAATNHDELLDRAVWRRFQLRLGLPHPSAAERAEWLRTFEARTGLVLGHNHLQLAKVLGAISYAELEQFALDVQRRYVLSLHSGDDLRAVVHARLRYWASRLEPRAPRVKKRDA